MSSYYANKPLYTDNVTSYVLGSSGSQPKPKKEAPPLYMNVPNEKDLVLSALTGGLSNNKATRKQVEVMSNNVKYAASNNNPNPAGQNVWYGGNAPRMGVIGFDKQGRPIYVPY